MNEATQLIDQHARRLDQQKSNEVRNNGASDLTDLKLVTQSSNNGHKLKIKTMESA